MAPAPVPAPVTAAGTKTSSAPSAPPPAPQPAPAGGGRVLASPLARRIAEEKGLDITRLAGSGPSGRIVRQDIDHAVAAAPGAAGVPSAKGPRIAGPARPPYVPGGPEFTDEPLNSMRKIIATRMAQSLGPAPHFYLTVEVDMRGAIDLRQSANNLNAELKLTYNDIVVKACAAALMVHPEVNTSITGRIVHCIACTSAWRCQWMAAG